MFEVIHTLDFKDSGFDIHAEYLEPSDYRKIGINSFMIHVKFYNCFPISPTGHRSLLGIVVEKIPEPEEIDKVILEVYHSQPRIEIKPPSLFDENTEEIIIE